jgi:hypothetical protein
MIHALLLACGLVLATYATWRSYVAARAALGPLTHAGEPTRIALEAVQPLHERARLRFIAGRVALALGWLLLAMYGLFLASWSGVVTA